MIVSIIKNYNEFNTSLEVFKLLKILFVLVKSKIFTFIIDTTIFSQISLSPMNNEQ